MIINLHEGPELVTHIHGSDHLHLSMQRHPNMKATITIAP
jgi:hypothetical protein